MERHKNQRIIGMQGEDHALPLKRAQSSNRLGTIGPEPFLAVQLAPIMHEVIVYAGDTAQRLQPTGLIGRADAVMFHGKTVIEPGFNLL